MASPIQAFIAANRFGFGTKKGELQKIAYDPRGWLESQLDARYAHNPAFDGLPTVIESVRNMRDNMQKKRLFKRQQNPENIDLDKVKKLLQEQGKDYLKDIGLRTRVAAMSDTPFFERIVQFWSNHFTVSSTKKQEMGIVVDFEREAMRPNVMGSFHQLLRASTRHPAMLIYLDNQRSIGPKSLAGRRRDKGLNENLAREILELHTLGVNGGYTQQDVTEFAKILTGWTVDVDGKGDGSGFRFVNLMHEPGDKTLLGEVYRNAGVDEGERALATFAAHPSTAKFVATKMARHFIADEPPASAVKKLAAAFTHYNGELKPVYRTLLAMEETWREPLAKVKTPNDYILSVMRSIGVEVDDLRLAGAFKMLGQMPFSAPSPAGWSDRAKDWVSAEAILQRINLAGYAARGASRMLEPKDLLAETIGPVASKETQQAILRAGSREEAITLLFASPEFQRR